MRVGLLALLLAGHAGAATLAPDSLLCETPETLELVSSMANLRGQPASVVLTRAGAGVQLAERQEVNPIGTTFAKARNDGALNRRIITTCAAVGPASVEVLERRAISGIVLVKVTYQGRPAELWTSSAGITE